MIASTHNPEDTYIPLQDTTLVQTLIGSLVSVFLISVYIFPSQHNIKGFC